MSGQNPVLPPFPAFPANEPWNERQIREQVYLMADWLGYPAVVTETQDLISATARAWTDFIATAHINNVVAGWIQLEDIDIARGERVR